MNLPDGEVVPLMHANTPLSPAHSWRPQLKNILIELIDIIENDEDFGYFDSIIDVQTDALLIEKAMRKYCDEHNRRYSIRKGEKHEYRSDLLSTKSEIEKCFRGGYTTELEERILRVLTK